MTQEDKKLLLKDLCARLPYGVKIYNHLGQISTFYGIKENFIFVPKCVRYGISYDDVDVEKVKPYLRPMSSMTEKEKEELKREFCVDIREEDNGRHTETYGYITIYHNFNDETWYIPFEAIDWLNSHHLDYRGLIEKGLALEAPEDMY